MMGRGIRPFFAVLTAASALTCVGCHRAELSKPLIVILVPSRDNPFFKAEADAAVAEAKKLDPKVAE